MGGRQGVREAAALLRAAAATFCFISCISLNAGTTENAIWNGGSATSDNWNDTANWSGGNQPQGADANTAIHFAGSTRTSPNNDYGAFTLEGQILFDSGANSFTLGGNAIKLSFKIENNSANLQTYNMSGLSLAPSASGGVVELDPTNGDLTVNTPGSAIYLDNNAELDVFGSHVLTLNGAVQDGGGSSGKFVLQGPATVVFNAANTYTGGTFLNNGSLQFDSNGSAGGTVNLGNIAGANDASVFLRPTSGGKSVANDITVRSGNSGTMTIGGLNTSGTNAFSGTITLNKDVTLQAATGGTVTFNTLTASSARIANIGGSGNNGTVQFAGSADNLSIGATVNSGTLVLGKVSNGSVHAIGSGLTISNGATVTLGGSGGDQIYSGSFVTINSGGTFRTAGLSEGSSANGAAVGVGALTLQGGSVIDFGTGANGSTFSATSGSINGAGTISILNWTGTTFVDNAASTNDRLLFQSDPGYSSSQLSQFQFYDDSGNAIGIGAMELAFNGWYEIVPVPEPGTWVAGILTLVTLAGYRSIRRPGSARALACSNRRPRRLT